MQEKNNAVGLYEIETAATTTTAIRSTTIITANIGWLKKKFLLAFSALSRLPTI